jgi:GDP-6-deoxy-D-talose 4-dehydrogenase
MISEEMNLEHPSNRVLITGITGFTGKYLKGYLSERGFEVYGLTNNHEDQEENTFYSDITDKEHLQKTVFQIAPNYVIHLAAISFVGHPNDLDFYGVNVLGTQNLIFSCLQLPQKPNKIILVSSATVYGNQSTDTLDESLCPQPSNHYGISKLAMEHMAVNFMKDLPIIIVRPFNYTAPGQDSVFVIPKIAEVFKNRKAVLELGNIDVYREYNSIGYICEVYHKLLISSITSELVNVCSNQAHSLREIISLFQQFSNHNPEIKINPKFVRNNEIIRLTGCDAKLKKLIQTETTNSIESVVKSFL